MFLGYIDTLTFWYEFIKFVLNVENRIVYQVKSNRDFSKY